MSERKYTLTITETDKGCLIERTNKGFSIVELLGFINAINFELLTQFKDDCKPNETVKKFIDKDDSENILP